MSNCVISRKIAPKNVTEQVEIFTERFSTSVAAAPYGIQENGHELLHHLRTCQPKAT